MRYTAVEWAGMERVGWRERRLDISRDGLDQECEIHDAESAEISCRMVRQDSLSTAPCTSTIRHMEPLPVRRAYVCFFPPFCLSRTDI